MLTFDDVVSLAREFVRQKFPLIPPVGLVWHYRAEPAGELLLEMWMNSSNLPMAAVVRREPLAEFVRVEVPIPADSEDADLARVGRWKVRFSTSWNTDEAGLPVHLALEIDEAGSVRQLPQTVRDDFDLE